MYSLVKILKFTTKAGEKLARLVNLNEIDVVIPIPDFLNTTIKQNNLLINILNSDNTKGIKSLPQITTTDYFATANLAIDYAAVMVAINPDATSQEPNALELAVLCNKIAGEASSLIDNFLGSAQKYTNYDQDILLNQSLYNEKTMHIVDTILEGLSAYSHEKLRAKNKLGAVGILAKAVHSLRNIMQSSASYLTPPESAQLLSLSQLSSLGKMPEGFTGKVIDWDFFSSYDKTVSHSTSISANKLALHHKAFEDPVTMFQIIDKYANTGLLKSLARNFKQKIANSDTPITAYDLSAMNYLMGKIDEKVNKADATAEKNAYIDTYHELLSSYISLNYPKDMNRLKAEIALTKYLQDINHMLINDKKYSDLPSKIQDELNKRFETVARVIREPVETVKANYESRIKHLPRGVHDLFTSADPVYRGLVKAYTQIGQKRHWTLDAQANRVSTDVHSSNIVLPDGNVYSSIESLKQAAASSAPTLIALREIGHSFSLAMASHLENALAPVEAKKELVDIAQLYTAERAANQLAGSIALTYAINTALTAKIINKLYEDTKSNSTLNLMDIKLRSSSESYFDGSDQSADHVLRLFEAESNQANTIDGKKIHLQNLCRFAKNQGVSKEQVVNFLVNQNSNIDKLRDWLEKFIDPNQGVTKIKHEINKGLVNLSITVPLAQPRHS
jgi:hypothetical protein